MQSDTRNNLIITANSTASFLLSYLLVYLLFQLATVSASALFDIPTTLYHNRIAYNVNPESWTFDSVKVIFSAGNALLTVLMIVFLVVYLKAMEFNGILRLFFLWGFMHCLTMLLGSAVIGAFNFEGFGIVMSYLYLQDTAKMFILFAGLILIMAVGILMVRPMFFSANIYYNLLEAEKRRKFTWYQFMLPYLISVVIIGLLRFPLSLYEWLLLAVPLFYLMPLYWGTGRLPTYYFDESPIRIRLSYALLLSAVVLIAATRIGLGIGIDFG